MSRTFCGWLMPPLRLGARILPVQLVCHHLQVAFEEAFDAHEAERPAIAG